MNTKPSEKAKKYLNPLIALLIAVIALLSMIVLMNVSGQHEAAVNNKAAEATLKTESSPAFEHTLLTPDMIKGHTKAGVCSLLDMALTDDDLQKIADVSKPQELKLSRCKFQSASHKPLHLPFEAVRIASSEVSPDFIRLIPAMPAIKCAEFYDCSFQPNSLTPLATARITWLQIRDSKVLSSDNSFTAADVAEMSKISKLDHLELERSVFQADALKNIKPSKAQVLNFNHCNLSDADASAISEMTNLHFIDATNNSNLTSAGILRLLSAHGIKQIKCDVDMSSCHLSKEDKKRLDPARYIVPLAFYEKSFDD